MALFLPVTVPEHTTSYTLVFLYIKYTHHDCSLYCDYFTVCIQLLLTLELYFIFVKSENKHLYERLEICI